MKESPYLPFPKEPDAVARLVPLKDAASENDCSENTLRNNAKARRLPAYQRRHGAPVYVLPEEVEEFLRRRPNIGSVFHPDGAPVDGGNSKPSPAPAALPPGAGLPLQCLNGASPEIVRLVSRCLNEIAQTLLSQPVREDEPDKVVP